MKIQKVDLFSVTTLPIAFDFTKALFWHVFVPSRLFQVPLHSMKLGVCLHDYFIQLGGSNEARQVKRSSATLSSELFLST